MASSPDAAADSVLVVVAPQSDAAAVDALVREAGYRRVTVRNRARAVAALGRRRFGCLVIDLALGRDAVRLLRAVVGRADAPAVVALADPRDPEASAEALRLGAIEVVPRPVARDALRAALANAAEYRRAPGPAEAVEAVEVAAPGSLTLSLGLRRILESVQHLSRSRANVLIVGERGSGREVLACALHARGPDAAEPLEVVDCARAAGGPAEREAADEIVRCVAGAVSRSVFLRNLHELAAPAQGALGRALEARERAPVGRRRAPGRILASAEPAITEAVARGRFDPELFTRLAVVRLDVPPLRARPQDIPLLGSEFLRDACARHGLAPKSLTPAARALLAALPWRGNADELRLLVERLALMVPRGAILLEDVLAQVSLDGAAVRGEGEGTLRAARERFERDYIMAVLLRHHGRVGAAARALGVERTHLYRKMKHLGIRWR